MYAWIWRHLPFGLRGKIAGSLLLLVGVVAGLWFGLFPVIEPIMPFNDGEITNTGPTATQDAPSTTPTGAGGPGAASGGPGVLPGDGGVPSSRPASASNR